MLSNSLPMPTPHTPLARSEDRFPIDVVIASPRASLRGEVSEKLAPPRWRVTEVGSGARAMEVLASNGIQDGILILDHSIPDLEPVELDSMIRARFPNIQVLTLDAQNGQLLVGASSPTTLSSRVVSLINHTESKIGSVPAPKPESAKQVSASQIHLRGMIGASEPMQRTFAMTRMVAMRDTTVLVTGESGTGKDLIAQEIHLISPRRKQPFVVVNCSAIPEALLEAELFGYTKGSFTGAAQSRIGRVHAAHGGTLFLDEIGDMPLSLQSKILRFLEQGEVQRLGGNDNLKVDVRVVAATNADLKKLASQNMFREDLYYRLAVFPIHLSPLRDRMGDLEALVGAFVTKFDSSISVSREALHLLHKHNWPGNVRELRNVVERATILVGSGKEVKAEHILL